MKYLGVYEQNQDIATKEKVEEKLSYDATSDIIKQKGVDVTESVAGAIEPFISPGSIGAVAYTNQELTDEQKQQARANIGIPNASDVFWATYSVTTSEEIEAAYQAGKVVLCFYSLYLYRLVRRVSSNFVVFGVVNDGYNRKLQCSNDTWSGMEVEVVNPYYAINRTKNNNVNAPNTNYTTLMARGEKLLDATTFDAVTDWSAELVNGAIAWRFE